jgi:hypothetical protein
MMTSIDRRPSFLISSSFGDGERLYNIYQGEES